jgi:hypothetical protein
MIQETNPKVIRGYYFFVSSNFVKKTIWRDVVQPLRSVPVFKDRKAGKEDHDKREVQIEL